MRTRSKLLIGLGVLLAFGLGSVARISHADQPPLRGEMADFTLLHPPVPAPPAHFTDPGKGKLDLTAFAGQLVLVNLWATWCGPCLEEMPSLIKLKQARENSDFRVVTIAEDHSGAAAVVSFLDKHGFDTLDRYVDPDLTVGTALGIGGMPTTYLINAKGRVIGRLEGKADWNSSDARALIDWYLAKSKQPGEPQTEKISAP